MTWPILQMLHFRAEHSLGCSSLVGILDPWLSKAMEMLAAELQLSEEPEAEPDPAPGHRAPRTGQRYPFRAGGTTWSDIWVIYLDGPLTYFCHLLLGILFYLYYNITIRNH